MRKLFKLREWLTLSDAARQLSMTFEEEVTEADVLRLGLDGHLRLSVNFVNHARARRGKIIPWEDTDWRLSKNEESKIKTDEAIAKETRPLPSKLKALFENLPPSERSNCYTAILDNLSIDNERFLTLNNEVTSLTGIWDLPMIGNERTDIQHRYQELTGGPAVTLTCLDGSFVQGLDGQMCQLQETFDEVDFPEIPLKASKDQFEEFLYKVNHLPKIDYFPADRLPDDSVIVVRTAALHEFERLMNDEPLPDSRAHVSDKFARLNQAAAKFWSNADPSDRGTHVENATVAAWLMQHGYSRSLADKAATIIRPEWAPSGRKPEE